MTRHARSRRHLRVAAWSEDRVLWGLVFMWYGALLAFVVMR